MDTSSKSRKHMKRCSISLNHQKYSNGNHKEIPVHIHLDGCNVTTDIVKYGDDVEPPESSYATGGNVKQCSDFGQKLGSFYKVK